jgi:N-acetylmuramoyl-L-alanine amidase
MKRIASRGKSPFDRVLSAAAIAAVFALCFALPAHADRKSEARDQFEHAVKLRTMLEGYLEKDRTLSDYRKTVAAYHRVYFISTQVVEVTPSLVAEGELYQEMGRLFDPKYFQSAIDAYNFLLKQYPGSRYRGEALFAVAQIQKDNLDKPADAEASYKEYLKRFPRSDKSNDARQALKEIATGSVREAVQAQAPPPEANGQRVEPRVSDKSTPSVTGIQTWNAEDATHIVVTLDDTIKYDAVRIASPDRIYFDLYKAKLGAKLSTKSIDVQSGLLKSVRVAQNKEGVVRLVLDVDGAKDYSAYLLAKPYRLVVDVRSKPDATAKRMTPSAPAQAASAEAEPAMTAKVAPEKSAAKSPEVVSETVSVSSTKNSAPAQPSAKTAARVAASVTPILPKKSPMLAALAPPTEPKPTREGDRSLTRALGLKISRIVIDAGHGGHDTGTIGPHGLMEKDLCLDVALRLGSLIEEKLPGAEVIYTRKDDTFIPLEERTAIANEAKADLFISIHANSSHDPAARGIETYYLNFATSSESMEVASRENANSQESLHDLQDLIQKIARNEKIEESKELASDIQDTLTARMQLVNHGEKNRGVKKAPFVVLIGANMPSVLSEISFVSNPGDEKLLRKPDQRQRIADGLYRGVAAYLDNLNSLTYNKQKLVSENHASGSHLEPASVASNGNPK